ncbi:MAG: DUF445 family protein [Clostridia bacterium]|nr:DUF445 family protein [Clostridia bacterium]
MFAKLALLAIIGAFIGWMTNVFAIKLLFRPLKPINILGFKLQGLIPKRKADIAESIGETVEKELVSVEEIVDKMIEQTDKEMIINEIRGRILSIVDKKMPILVPPTMRNMIIGFVNEAIDDNAETMMNEMSEKLIHHATEKVSISLLIQEKIMEFPLEKLERIIMEIAKKELKHIEYLGGVIGFLIGILQGLIVLNM